MLAYSALSNTGTFTLIYFGKKILPVQAYLIYFWALLSNFISKICIQEEQICHPVRLFHPVPVFDSVEYEGHMRDIWGPIGHLWGHLTHGDLCGTFW